MERFWTTSEGYTSEYYNIVDQIETAIAKEKPNTYGTVKPVIDDLLHNPTGKYSLLYGLVQEGKSLAAILVIWLASCKYHLHTLFVTKSLATIREDIFDKIENGYLHGVISRICAENNLSPEVTSHFFQLSIELYNKDKSPAKNKVFIHLMQKDNHLGLLKIFQETLSEKRPAPSLFVIDEIHEMYTNYHSFQKNHGVVRKSITNRTIMHYLHDYLQKNLCYILGITATPYRPMSGDPHVLPGNIYELQSDPPFPGAIYCGYSREKEELQNIEIHEYQTDNKIITELKEIIQAPRKIVEGRCEIPFVLITTEHYKSDQDFMLQAIQSEFGDLVYGRTIHEGPATETNIKSIADFFNPNKISEQVWVHGIIVLIGKKCIDTGISVKPPIGKTFQRKINQIDYFCSGSSHQFVALGSLESMMQSCRLFGWHIPGHESHLYVPHGTRETFYKGLISLCNQFVRKYNGKSGVAQIVDKYKIKNISGTGANDTYHSDGKHRLQWSFSSSQPKQGIHLQTQIIIPTGIDIEYWKNHGKTKLVDFFKDGKKQSILRKECFKNFHTSRFQIGYSAERYDQILQAIVEPREGSQNLWQVNAFLSGKNKELSSLQEIRICNFLEKWENRTRISSCQGETMYFWDGFSWVIFNYLKSFLLKETEIVLSKNHYLACGPDLDKAINRVKNKKLRKLTAWDVIRKYCKMKYGTGSSKFCSHFRKILQKTSESAVQEILSTSISDKEKIEKIFKICDDLFTDKN